MGTTLPFASTRTRIFNENILGRERQMGELRRTAHVSSPQVSKGWMPAGSIIDNRDPMFNWESILDRVEALTYARATDTRDSESIAVATVLPAAEDHKGDCRKHGDKGEDDQQLDRKRDKADKRYEFCEQGDHQCDDDQDASTDRCCF